MARANIVGRDAEVAAVTDLLTEAPSPRAVVIVGGPGIGKTTLWEAGIQAAGDGGVRVLSARPSGAETQLAFAVLIDLLDGVGDEELAGLPAPQRRALEVALLRADPDGTALSPPAIAVGFLTALRALSARQPLLLAIDDVQWLDAPSAEALAFAARRLDGHPVRFLLARRSGPVAAFEAVLERAGLERLDLSPLTLDGTRRLLAERHGLSLSRQVLRRVFETTLGNPLFTLELGRTLLEQGPPRAAGDDIPVPEAVEELLGTRVARLPEPVGRLLLAVALSGDLRVAQLAALAEPGALDDALAAGLLHADGDRVRASHPLLAAAARGHSRPGERRELHGRLAGVVAGEELRALHLAHATDGEDAGLAATVSLAAEGAAARGARQEAVELGEHALRLTPDDDPERGERLLALAGHLGAAGLQPQVTELLADEVEGLPPGEARVRACLLLKDGVVENNDDIERYLERALAEARGDPELRAPVLAEMSDNTAVVRVERIREAEAWALEALAAVRPDDPAAARSALHALAWARSLRGLPIDDVRERFDAVSDAASYIAGSPARIEGQRLVWRGDLDQARPALTRLLRLADERGEPYSYALQRLHLCELELRAGRWDAVGHLLDEWAESADGRLLIWPMYERCRALLAAGRGLPDETERWAAEAIRGAEAVGVRWDGLEALRARGMAALLSHDPARAVESLGAVWEHTAREGVDEAGVFPVAPELVEAHVELGALEEARAVTDRLRRQAQEQEHPWGLATARRCVALVRLASGTHAEEAAAQLADAAAALGALGLRFDRARTLLATGRTQRRLRKWGAARRTLEDAAAAFEEMGSAGWAEEARSELGRIGARRPGATGALTPSERRVAELVSEGLSNKEIAQRLVVSVRTVEAHLSHVYAKLGVTSRTQLARASKHP